MSQQDQDFQVPDLGPAEQRSNTPVSSRPSAPNSGGGWLNSLIMILLTLACCALGYYGFDAYNDLQSYQQALSRAEKRIGALEEQLQAESESAAQENLPNQISHLQNLLDTTRKETGQQITQLTEQLEQLSGKTHKSSRQLADLSQHSQRLSTLEKTQAEQQTHLDSLQNRQKALASHSQQASALSEQMDTLSKAQTSLKQVQDKNRKLSQDSLQQAKDNQQAIASLRTQLAILEESLGEEQAALNKKLKDTAARLNRLAKTQSSSKQSAALESRIKVNEQAIHAIDGTRRKMNNDIRLLQERVNRLQSRM